MKKYTSNLPVSKKAYDGFIERINTIVRDASRREMMFTALERYLDGDTDGYAAGLDDACALAFEFLRADVDAAIRRSAAARSRAARRRQEEEKTFAAFVSAFASTRGKRTGDTHKNTPATTDDSEQQQEPPLPIPRYMRRAQERTKRPKNKWRKIG